MSETIKFDLEGDYRLDADRRVAKRLATKAQVEEALAFEAANLRAKADHRMSKLVKEDGPGYPPARSN